LRIQVSQGSAAADLRGDGTFLSSGSENTTVKGLLKSVYICQSYCKNKNGTFFETQCRLPINGTDASHWLHPRQLSAVIKSTTNINPRQIYLTS